MSDRLGAARMRAAMSLNPAYVAEMKQEKSNNPLI